MFAFQMGELGKDYFKPSLPRDHLEGADFRKTVPDAQCNGSFPPGNPEGAIAPLGIHLASSAVSWSHLQHDC